MAIKRYKAVMRTQAGIRTVVVEANGPSDARRKALATLADYEKPASADIEEVGDELPRTMP